MSELFGQGAINDDEFLPNQEEMELKIRSDMEATITISNKADDKLRQ